MQHFRADERPHYDRWLRALAGDDPRLRFLLEATLGRIAAGNLRRILDRRGDGRAMKLGDLPASKPMPGEAEVLAGWLRDALEHEEDWLRDLDADRVPRRLAACESYEDLLDAANEDFEARRWTLPGR